MIHKAKDAKYFLYNKLTSLMQLRMFRTYIERVNIVTNKSQQEKMMKD